MNDRLSNFSRDYFLCFNATSTIITNNLFQYDTKTKLKEAHNSCVNLSLEFEDEIRKCKNEPSWEKQKECIKKKFIMP